MIENISSDDRLRENIIRLRENKNMSQSELAKRMRIDNSYISKIERGTRKVSTSELDKFAEIFEVTTDYLLGRTEDPTATLNDENDEIDDMLDSAMTRDGKPLSNNDRNVIRGMIEAYLKNKE